MDTMSDTELDEYIEDMNKFEEVAERHGIDAEAFEAFCDNQHIKADDCEDAVRDFEEAFVGEFSCHSDFALDYHYENGDLDRIPGNLDAYIDWDDVWHGELRHEFYEIGGYYFRNI